MRPIVRTLLLFSLVFVALCPLEGRAQVIPHQHPAFHEIEEALQNRMISKDEAILQKFYMAHNPDRVQDRFKTEPEGQHHKLRCFTPVVQEYLRMKADLLPATVDEIERMLARPSSQQTEEYVSDSGNFIFYYETEGEDAVPMDNPDVNGVPEYVRKAAFAADSSYRYQVEELGFVDFRRTNPYEIYFEKVIVNGSDIYGDTRTSPDRTTTFIRVHNTFEGFPENSHPEGNAIGALYATIAHEIKHASQFATNRWEGSAGSFDWSEMDATLMEETTFDDVNDYYNYIKEDFDSAEPYSSSIFGTPQSPTPGAYWHVTWMLYFAEQFGMEYWVDVWDQFVENRTLPFLDAVEESLQSRNTSLAYEHLQNHMWHMASGPAYSPPFYGFEEREAYPNPNFNSVLTTTPDSLTGRNISAFAANYIDATAVQVAPGQPIISVESSVNGVGLGVIGYFNDGTTRQRFVLDPGSSNQTIQTTWNWSDLSDISIAVVNSNRSESATYSLYIYPSIPEEDVLVQNYPNPFYPDTRIDFTLNEQKRVILDVHDALGRKVQTLVDETRNPGYYSIDFDGSGLASGVYYYRIRTNEKTTTKKMVLIK
ncbi:MAG: T9SS type A sorting domain-containing protein [Balneolaceae bacterium]